MEGVKPTARSGTLWILAEAATLCGLGLVAMLWIIPAETTAGGIGLEPAALPTACIVAAMALILLDAAIRLFGRRTAGETPLPVGPALSVIGVCLLGAVLLQFMNPAVCTIFMLPPLMMILGERSVLRIVLTTIVTTAILAAALAWRV